MKKIITAAAAIYSIGAAGMAGADVSLSIRNQSKWELHHLYLSPVGLNNWGEDQLGDGTRDTVATGESFTLVGIEAGKYDLKIVDEDGDECTLDDVEFTTSDSVTLTDDLLLSCQVATKEEEKE